MDFVSQLPWSSIAGAVTPFAPKIGTVLGTAFGGPAGGFIGGIAGRAIAGAFNVAATPEAVGKAIAGDSKAGEKLARLEAAEGERIRQEALVEIERIQAETEQLRVTAEAGTAQQTNVNETMRAELQARIALNSDSKFHNGWRPMCGWLLVYDFGMILGGMSIGFFHYMVTGDKFLLITLNDNMTNLLILTTSLAAVNGVTSWGKSYERGKAMQASAPEATATIVTAPAPANANAPIAGGAGIDVADIVTRTIRAVRGR